MRRTIWDGDQELAEIQMPWALQGANLVRQWDTTQTPTWWENDVSPVSLGRLDTWDVYTGDPNPYFGHVIYAGRRGVDQPIAVTRVNYVMAMDWKYRFNFVYNPPRVVAPFTIVPFWNARGDAPVGVFSNGYQALCGAPSADTACVAIRWPWNWSSSDRNGGLPHDYWHGTLLEGKRDESGFRYMRNRYYDPLTGRFTQEDPIGLAGGLNAYGFAAGDPINFSDPFGLKECEGDGEDHVHYSLIGTFPNVRVNEELHDCAEYRKAQEAKIAAADPCRHGLTEKCAQVRRGLVALFTSPDSICRRLGTQANERFLKGRFSYIPSMSGEYARTGPLWRTLLGIARTELGPATFLPGETANTLAHEEYHAESIWHNFGEGGANRVGYQCAGPI